MASGGYRRPSSPAPVSGPGAMSQRTDGGPAQPVRAMTGGDYGDSQELATLQGSAPMAAAAMPQTQGQRATAPQPGAALPTPMGAPTERPDEPVTSGNPLGPGSSTPPTGPASIKELSSKDGEALKPYLPALIDAANAPNVPGSFVKFVQYLRSM